MRIFLREIAHNQILWVALTAWFWAQFLKGITEYIKEKKINFRRFVAGAGGMPSSHSALVASLTTAIGITQGWDNPLTALALISALVIMYDAAGVRQAASKQAVILNKILDEIFEGQFHQERLKELLGHTPVEVFAGAALGALIAVLMVK